MDDISSSSAPLHMLIAHDVLTTVREKYIWRMFGLSRPNGTIWERIYRARTKRHLDTIIYRELYPASVATYLASDFARAMDCDLAVRELVGVGVNFSLKYESLDECLERLHFSVYDYSGTQTAEWNTFMATRILSTPVDSSFATNVLTGCAGFAMFCTERIAQLRIESQNGG